MTKFIVTIMAMLASAPAFAGLEKPKARTQLNVRYQLIEVGVFQVLLLDAETGRVWTRECSPRPPRRDDVCSWVLEVRE